MNITYPKDTPQWLIDTVKSLGEQIESDVINTSADQFLVVKGEMRFYRRLCEEIDALGNLEISKEKERANAATRRS